MAILISLLYVAWVFLVNPYASYLVTQYSKIERAQQKLHALNELINNKDAINKIYRSMKNNRSLERVYLGRSGGVIAEAKLQGIVRRLIEKNNSNLIETSQINNTSDDKNKITLKVSMRGSIDSAYKIFYQLENSWPVMTVNNVELTRINNRYARNSYSDSLNSVFEITAYVQ